MARKKIKLDKKNTRKHGPKSKKFIKQSLEENGAGRSILIDNDNEVIAGNGVFEQAEELGLKTKIIETDGSELIVVKRTDLSSDDDKRRNLAIADNAVQQFSEWNTEEITLEEAEKWEIPIEDFKEPTKDDLIGNRKENPPTIKITFSSVDELEKFKKFLDGHLKNNYKKSFYSVSMGEL